MTVEDAIKILKEDALIQECMIEHDNEIDKEIFDCDASSNISKKQALDMAIEALEKQISKSPERYIQPGVCVCPNCNGIIEAHTSKTFCTYCGQSITYSESDSVDE